MTPERAALYAGAAAATAVLGVIIFDKVRELQSPAGAARTEAYVAQVVEQEAVRHLLTKHGLSAERVAQLERLMTGFR